MQRVVDEAEYVLTVLRRMREEIAKNPDQYDPDAQEKMEEEIACIQEVLRSARSVLQKWTVQQEVKAA